MNQELLNYIHSCRAQGWTDDQIRQTLLENGYSPVTVDPLFKPQPPIPAPYQPQSESLQPAENLTNFSPAKTSAYSLKLFFGFGVLVLICFLVTSSVYAYFRFAPTTSQAVLDQITNTFEANDLGYVSTIFVSISADQSNSDKSDLLGQLFSDGTFELASEGQIVKQGQGYNYTFDSQLKIDFFIFNNVSLNVKGLFYDNSLFVNLSDTQMLKSFLPQETPENAWLKFNRQSDTETHDPMGNVVETLSSGQLAQLAMAAINEGLFKLEKPTVSPPIPTWRNRGHQLVADMTQLDRAKSLILAEFDNDPAIARYLDSLENISDLRISIWIDIFTSKLSYLEINSESVSDESGTKIGFKLTFKTKDFNTGYTIQPPAEAIDVSELTRKQQDSQLDSDTQTRSDAAQLINALDRYVAIFEEYPWNSVAHQITGASKAPTSFYFMDRSNWSKSEYDAWADQLIYREEVKSGYIDSLRNETTGKKLTIVHTDNYTTYVCFVPTTIAFKQEAATACQENKMANLKEDPLIPINLCPEPDNIQAENYLCLP